MRNTEPGGAGPVVVVFPGQGSQRVGMARDFYDASAAARTVFAEASTATGLDIAALCFEPQDEQARVRLGLTEYTQPAILTAQIAMFEALREQYDFAPTHFAGHSLGEYTALAAAGVIPLTEAVRLVRERGRRMQQAVPEGVGAMAAVVGRALPVDHIVQAIDGLNVDLANLNSVDQVVLSGATDDVDVALARLRARDDLQARFVKLDVSAPFHSRMMTGIELGFRAVMAASSMSWDLAAAPRVLSNFTGTWHVDRRDALLDALTQQISGSVRWTQNMQVVASLHPQAVYEIGSSRPLQGFLRTVGVDTSAITRLGHARRLFGEA